jgi:hypothetical protein
MKLIQTGSIEHIKELIKFSLFAEQVSEYTNDEEKQELINKIAVNILQYISIKKLEAMYLSNDFEFVTLDQKTNYIDSDYSAKYDILKNKLIKIIQIIEK